MMIDRDTDGDRHRDGETLIQHTDEGLQYLPITLEKYKDSLRMAKRYLHFYVLGSTSIS